MLKYLISLSLATLCSCTALAQTATVTTPFAVTGLVDTQTVGNLLLVSPESKPVFNQVGLIKVSIDSEMIAVKARNPQGRPIPVQKVDAKTFLILTTGEVWANVVCVDFDKRLYINEDLDPFTINGAGPVPPPGPGPVPTPDTVPADEFDNIGQKVYGWSQGLPKRAELGALYREYSQLVANSLPGSMSLNELAIVYLNKKSTLLGPDANKYNDFNQKLFADYNARAKAFDRVDLSLYWAAVAKGLEVK